MRSVGIFVLFIGLLLAGCGKARVAPPPAMTAGPAPVLVGMRVMLFPTQFGAVPIADTTFSHFPLDRAALDAEIAYWLPQLGRSIQWIPPATVQRALDRSPALGIDIRNLPVTSFQRAQVRRIGDPLYGDLRKLAAVLDARIAIIPVAAEYIGVTPNGARVQIATAVIDALDGTVLWFGVLQSEADGMDANAAVASAAQVFARAFAGGR
jgi:hypothetical protein